MLFSPSNLASRYLGISAVMHQSLEKFIVGEIENIPKMVLKSAVDLLQRVKTFHGRRGKYS